MRIGKSMITRSFRIFQDVDKNIESKLVQQGIEDWEDFLQKEKIYGVSREVKSAINQKINQYKQALQKKDYGVFKPLGPQYHWQLYEILKRENKICYLDIETTGLKFLKDDITMVGIYDGKNYINLTKNRNLNQQSLKEIIDPFDMLVTHYGLKFDIPFLSFSFPEVNFDKLHFDVSFNAEKLNLGKDLKEVEKSLEIWREKHIADISGFQAVKLWEEYLKGNEESLKLLIEHNRNDVINLAKIADKIFEILSNTNVD